ncbi:MAG: YitT family protein [Bacteroidota bacterium]|nr:YitT family protein [Bacteroidota bacterium]
MFKKLFAKLISFSLRVNSYKTITPNFEFSRYAIAKAFFDLKIVTKQLLKNIVFIALGIISAAFGLESFLLPNSFVDGGATGISLLLNAMTFIPLPILIIVVNAPFVFLGYKLVSRPFAIKTAIAITTLAICLSTIHFPIVTDDKLLVAVFGGFFLGAGIGLAMRGGAVIDGTEVLAIYLSKKLSITIGDVIIIINVIIFGAAAYVINIETALYSMITYLAASKTLDFVVQGIDEYTGVTIVSSHHAYIREMIVSKMGRGVTIYKGKRGVGKASELMDVDIVYTVVTRLEINKLNTEILKIDPFAFVVMSNVKDTHGGMIKKRSID